MKNLGPAFAPIVPQLPSKGTLNISNEKLDAALKKDCGTFWRQRQKSKKG